MRPLCKWPGGKTSLLSELTRRLPNHFDVYCEPFVGAGALFFWLADQNRFKRAVLGDRNVELITTYRAVRDRLEDVLRYLREHARQHSPSHFYRIRGTRFRSDPCIAARFLYLNRTCFNGLYRVNAKGTFNVSLGRYRDPAIVDEEHLRNASSALKGTVLFAGDFEVLLRRLRPEGSKAVVYLDPPYIPVGPTANFTNYTGDGFGFAEQLRLRNAVRELKQKGIHMLLSNSDTPSSRRLYRGFAIERVHARRSIACRGDRRGWVGEILVM